MMPIKMFKSPTEKDITDKGRMTPTQTVRALYSAQWGFYKYGFDTMLKIAGIELIIILILSVTIVFLVGAGSPEPKFFWVNSQRQLGEIHPVSEAATNEDQVRQFVNDAVLESMNFTYDDYKQRLTKAAVYFTDEGFTAWTNALRDGGVFAQMQEKQLLLRTVLTAVPEIVKQDSRKYGDVFIWVYTVSVQRTVSDRSIVKTNNYTYKVNVRQVPLTEKASGLAIYSIKEVPQGVPGAPQ
jgi:hypothetical protein